MTETGVLESIIELSFMEKSFFIVWFIRQLQPQMEKGHMFWPEARWCYEIKNYMQSWMYISLEHTINIYGQQSYKYEDQTYVWWPWIHVALIIDPLNSCYKRKLLIWSNFFQCLRRKYTNLVMPILQNVLIEREVPI